MKSFLIIGLGRFGGALAEELFRLGHEVVAIDRNEAVVESFADKVTHAVCVDASREHALDRIGVQNFDCAVVAFAQSVQDNILMTLLLKDAGIREIIVKGSNRMHVRVLNKLGVSKVVFPEQESGIKLAQAMSSNNMLNYVAINDKYSIVEISPPGKWIGNSIIQLNIRAKYGLSILLIKRADGVVINVNPRPDYIVHKDDILVVIGANDDIERLEK